MALTAFPDGSYLELIAWTDPKAAHPGQSWAKFMDKQGGRARGRSTWTISAGSRRG